MGQCEDSLRQVPGCLECSPYPSFLCHFTEDSKQWILLKTFYLKLFSMEKGKGERSCVEGGKGNLKVLVSSKDTE